MLSCIGAIKIKMHRTPVGTLKRCTIIQDVDQWYALITADDGIIGTAKSDASKPVGADVDLINWLTLSDGKVIQNPLEFKAQAKCIRELQRNVARKEKGSRNREKAEIQLAKAWKQVRRHGDDFVHKTSKSLADEYTLIVFEKLNMPNMVKNHSLTSAITDATRGKLHPYTAYKVERRGRRTIIVNPCGTSQKCSRYGVVAKEELDLSVHTSECGCCGLVIDRDLNAAINFLKQGLEQACAEKQPILVHQ